LLEVRKGRLDWCPRETRRNEGTYNLVFSPLLALALIRIIIFTITRSPLFFLPLLQSRQPHRVQPPPFLFSLELFGFVLAEEPGVFVVRGKVGPAASFAGGVSRVGREREEGRD
jgi:hypothetical protein